MSLANTKKVLTCSTAQAASHSGSVEWNHKNISVQKGEKAFLDKIKYFFYITNQKDKAQKTVGLTNGRFDQEKVIEQLKNVVNAVRMAVRDLVSNWAYMVMAALAWNLKELISTPPAQPGAGSEIGEDGISAVPQCDHADPCQIVPAARRVICRVLRYNGWLADFRRSWCCWSSECPKNFES